MDVVPLVDEGLGNSAYLVDLGDGGALVVDPGRDPRPCLRELELGALTRPAEDLPDTSLLGHCGHGERAMSAASLLRRAGHDDVAVLAGGPDELGELETGAGS